MGKPNSKLLVVNPRFPLFTAFKEIAPGFWNLRAPFWVAGKTINLGTHMSVVEIAPNQFVALDCVPLNSVAAAELNLLTSNGETLIAVLNTHPFHTLAIAKFHTLYPSNAERKWYGCPRHLIKCTTDAAGKPINWAGDLNDCSVRRKFEPALKMSIPDGAEFIDPKPPTRNHLACVLVLHVSSRTVHVDDCMNWIQDMGVIPRLAIGNKMLTFHPSLLYSGLHPTAQAPLQFKTWAQKVLVDEWEYDTLATAHNAILRGNAKQKVIELLAKKDEALRKLSIKNAVAEAEKAATAQWEGKMPKQELREISDSECQDCWSDVEIECG